MSYNLNLNNKHQYKLLKEEFVLTTYLTFLVIKFIIHFLKIIMGLLIVRTKPMDSLNFPINTLLTTRLGKVINRNDISVRLDRSWDVENAYTHGDKNIYYTKKLSKMMSDDELLAICLHEYGHINEKHVYKSMAKQELISLLMSPILAIPVGFIGDIYPFGIFIQIILQFIVGPGIEWQFMYKKYQADEYVADSYAKKYGYEKELISAFKKFEMIYKKKLCEDLSKNECELFLEKLHKYASHPSFKDRIDKLSEKLKMLINKYGITKTVKILNMVTNKSFINKNDKSLKGI